MEQKCIFYLKTIPFLIGAPLVSMVISTSINNSQEEVLIEPNNSFESSLIANKQKSPKFEGTVLDKAAVEALGWNTKNQITLLDWEQAPNVTSIGDENSTFINAPFEGNRNLELFEVPARITIIGNFAFRRTPNLNTINFEGNSNLLTIFSKAFDSSAITSITIPSSVTWMANDAFVSTNLLEQITFDYILYISGGSIEPNFGLTQMQWDSIVWNNIPKTGMINKIIATNLLKSNSIINWNEISSFSGIDRGAFSGTNITSIQIHYKSGFTIRENAFANTPSLTKIEFSDFYKDDVIKYGFTENQLNSIKYIVTKTSNDNLPIIIGSAIGGILLIAAASGLFWVLKNKRKKVLVTGKNDNENQEYYDENQEYYDENQEYYDENQEYYDEYEESVDDYQDPNHYK
ncbi:MAG: leucine-rich repeat protein [Metamycoplasmataceae bacterium]